MVRGGRPPGHGQAKADPSDGVGPVRDQSDEGNTLRPESARMRGQNAKMQTRTIRSNQRQICPATHSALQDLSTVR